MGWPSHRSASGRLSARLVLFALGALTAVSPAAAADWPMFHGDQRHTGVSGDTAIDAANAATLGSQWQANLGAAGRTSPVIVHSAGLNRDLVYAGSASGVMSAYDATTGERVWSRKVGGNINSTPAIAGGKLWFGSADKFVRALNPDTGAELCRFSTGGVISSSPVVAGGVVYVGDNGFSGADDGGHMWAINASNCTRKWMYDAFGDPPGSESLVGSWSPPAHGVDVNGRALVVFGSSSPEGAVYALDAVTGARVWRFPTQHFFLDEDVGAGPTISPPGVNGLADGAVYVGGKNNILYALNLRTGAKLWEFSFRGISGSGALRSTAALAGRTIYVGYGRGVMAVDAVTGTKVWSTEDHGLTTAEIVSSPAVTGAAGSEVVLAADVGGRAYAFRLSDGATLWTYDAGQLIYSSPGVAAGAFYLTSENGFIYSFAPGGGTSGKPDTVTTVPSPGASVPNPGGSLTFSGSATDDLGVREVRVGIRLNGKWWNAATRTWGAVYVGNLATLGSRGAPSTSWSLTFPVPSTGGPGQVLAEAVDGDGQHDPTVSVTNFRVTPLGNPPETGITSPVFKQIFFFERNPDGSIRRVSFPVAITGTATDTAGTTPGVRRVLVVVQNIEHTEYYCGPRGCPGQPGVFWRAAFISFAATLASPNATSTTWRTTFPVYDHPHRYRITAWAIDLENRPDVSRAQVARICVRDPGDAQCF